MSFTIDETLTLVKLTGKEYMTDGGRVPYLVSTVRRFNPLEHLSLILQSLTNDQKDYINEFIYREVAPQDGFHEFDYVSKISWFDDEERRIEILKAVLRTQGVKQSASTTNQGNQ